MKFQVATALLFAAAGLAEAGTWLEDAQATGDYDTLLQLVTDTEGVLGAIEANYPVTVFGPNDDAFAAIQSTLDTLTEEEVAGVLAGHVVAGEYRAQDVIDAGCVDLETLAGTMLKVSYNAANGSVMVNDASTVVQPDIGDDAATGVLHGVDAVILADYTPCTFIDAAAATGDYDTLLQLVTDTEGVLGAITDNAPVTVFGPNDDAFAAIQSTLDTLTEEEVFSTLAGHVVAGEYQAQAVIDAGCVELETLAGTMLKVTYSEDDGVMVNGVATVVDPDLGYEDTIGVLHGVDAVILGGFTPCPSSAPTNAPPVTFIDAATANGNYDTLLDLVTNTPGVMEAITDNAPVTVFGPNDDAFAAIQSTLDTLSEDDVFSTLAGHVVAGEYRAQAVIDAGCVELETLAGTMLKVTYSEDDGVMVNGVATVVDPDLGDEDTIGVLHGVDAVILDGFSPCTTSAPTSSAAEFTAVIGSLVTLLAGYVMA